MKKIIKSICFSLLAFMFAIGSIFLPVSSNNSTQYASADNTSTLGTQFISSNIVFNRIGVTGSDPGNNCDFDVFPSSGKRPQAWYNFSFKLTIDEAYPYRVNYFFSAVNTSGSPPSFANSYKELGYLNFIDSDTTTNGYLGNVKYSEAYFVDSGVSASNGYTRIVFALTGGDYTYENQLKPTLYMKSVEIGSSYDFYDNTGLNFDYDRFSNATIVSYLDTNNFRYTFFIPNCVRYDAQDVGEFNSTYYTYRKYYFTTPRLDNQEAYDSGYNSGKSDGYDFGFNDGYNNGLTTGYNDGYEDGVSDGINTSGNYTFVGLFSAVLDTPVKILQNLFNFDFLGINLWAFFTSILTIGLIVFVIKIFLRR